MQCTWKLLELYICNFIRCSFNMSNTFQRFFEEHSCFGARHHYFRFAPTIASGPATAYGYDAQLMSAPYAQSGMGSVQYVQPVIYEDARVQLVAVRNEFKSGFASPDSRLRYSREQGPTSSLCGKGSRAAIWNRFRPRLAKAAG